MVLCFCSVALCFDPYLSTMPRKTIAYRTTSTSSESPTIKIGKTKQVLGKIVLGNNKGGGDKYKDTNQVLKKLS